MLQSFTSQTHSSPLNDFSSMDLGSGPDSKSMRCVDVDYCTSGAGGSRLATLRIRSCFLTSERRLISHNVFPSPGVTKQQALPAVTLGSATAPCNLKAVARRDNIFWGSRVNCLHGKPWGPHLCRSEPSSPPLNHSATE